VSDQRIKIPRASDKVLIACFKDLAKITGVSQISINALGFNNIGAVDLDQDLPSSLELILKKNSAIIETISLNWPGLPITFYRGGNYQAQEKSGIYDEVVIRQNQNQGSHDSEEVIEVISVINKKLKAFDPKRSASGTMSEEQAHFEALHNSSIERLELLNEELIKSTHEYRLKLDDDHQIRLKDLEDEFENRKKELHEKIEEQESKITVREKSLDEERKKLDDSNNTHARREIRRDILKEIKARQDKFSLTEGTNKLRKPIALAMIGLIAIFVFLGSVSALEFYDILRSSDMSKILIASVKQFIYTGGAVASVVFLIRWMNRWFELHSQSEFYMKQFELDMERASWLVETSLEWKDAKGTAIPTELLESLSRNLFVNEGQKVEQVQHPADQLASALMGSASGVKLRAGDSSIEIDPRKLTKAKPIEQGT